MWHTLHWVHPCCARHCCGIAPGSLPVRCSLMCFLKHSFPAHPGARAGSASVQPGTGQKYRVPGCTVVCISPAAGGPGGGEGPKSTRPTPAAKLATTGFSCESPVACVELLGLVGICCRSALASLGLSSIGQSPSVWFLRSCRPWGAEAGSVSMNVLRTRTPKGTSSKTSYGPGRDVGGPGWEASPTRRALIPHPAVVRRLRPSCLVIERRLLNHGKRRPRALTYGTEVQPKGSHGSLATTA